MNFRCSLPECTMTPSSVYPMTTMKWPCRTTQNPRSTRTMTGRPILFRFQAFSLNVKDHIQVQRTACPSAENFLRDLLWSSPQAPVIQDRRQGSRSALIGLLGEKGDFFQDPAGFGARTYRGSGASMKDQGDEKQKERGPSVSGPPIHCLIRRFQEKFNGGRHPALGLFNHNAMPEQLDDHDHQNGNDQDRDHNPQPVAAHL